MTTDSIERSKIFIWGQVGKQLKDMDDERMLAIAQDDPDYFMSILANRDISEIIIQIIKEKGLSKESKKLILAVNKFDSVFREISQFMQHTEDMLSIGSFMTGELDKKKAMWILSGGDSND